MCKPGQPCYCVESYACHARHVKYSSGVSEQRGYTKMQDVRIARCQNCEMSERIPHQYSSQNSVYTKLPMHTHMVNVYIACSKINESLWQGLSVRGQERFRCFCSQSSTKRLISMSDRNSPPKERKGFCPAVRSAASHLTRLNK